MTATCPKCEYTRKSVDKAPEGECPSCGVIYEKFLEAQRRRLEASGEMTTKKRRRRTEAMESTAEGYPLQSIFAIMGAVLLVLGLFVPIVSAAGESISIFQIGRLMPCIILVVVAVTAVKGLLESDQKKLLSAGGGAVVYVVYNFYKSNKFVDTLRASKDEFIEYSSEYATEIVSTIDSVRLSWGWIVLILGAGLILASAFLDDK